MAFLNILTDIMTNLIHLMLCPSLQSFTPLIMIEEPEYPLFRSLASIFRHRFLYLMMLTPDQPKGLHIAHQS